MGGDDETVPLVTTDRNTVTDEADAGGGGSGGSGGSGGGGGGGWFGFGGSGGNRSRSPSRSPKNKKGGGDAPPPPIDARILVEIVGASDLPSPRPEEKEKVVLADPRCAVSYVPPPQHEGDGGGARKERVVHKTKSVKKTLDPIWTVATSSLFLLEINADAFRGRRRRSEAQTVGAAKRQASDEDSDEEGDDAEGEEEERSRALSGGGRGEGGGLKFDVTDSATKRSLGTTFVPADVILSGRGERIEVPLKRSSAGQKENSSGRGELALRFRPATTNDLSVCRRLQLVNSSSERSRKSSLGSEEEEEEDASSTRTLSFGDARKTAPSLITRRTRTDKETGLTQFLVKPYPDPNNVDETTWLTKDDIDAMSVLPSRKWIRAGSGEMGKLFVEVLSCDGLPNLDVGGLDSRNVTDPFVAALFEDTLVRTDVIHDSLHPRWMPWSQRAFCFPIMHPTSVLMLGVFDYDAGLLSDHDPVGRVVINHANLHSDTVYLLKYGLHSTPTKDDDRGTITIRLRIEWNDEKMALRQSFHKPPRFHINTDTKKSYHVIRYLCKGQVDMEKASLKTVSLYAGELASYINTYFYAIDVLLGILLWRGRLHLVMPRPTWVVPDEASTNPDVLEFNVWFPIHSIILFQAGIIATSHPSLIPSVIMFLLGWTLWTIGYHKSHNPSPWVRCKSSRYFTGLLVLGRKISPPVCIDANEGVDEAMRLEVLDKAKVKRVKTFLMAVKDYLLTFKRKYLKTDMEAITIETQDSGWWTNPLEKKLSDYGLCYLHLGLMYMCIYLRMVKNTLGWKSSTYSYKLMRTFFIAGFLFLFVPWGTVLLWSSRVFVWVVLGPWMKLIDMQYILPHYRTKDDLLKSPEIETPKIESMFEAAKYKLLAKRVRVAAEDSVKLKHMREKRFGEYTQLVPPFDQSLFPSVPLPASTASPYLGPGKLDKADFEFMYLPDDQVQWSHVPGQKIYGSMIHDVEEEIRQAVEECDDDDFVPLSC